MGGALNNQRIADVSGAAFAAVAEKNPVLLLPLGSVEDHGPGAPMGDFVLADVLAGRIAERCFKAGVLTYAAPALPFGVADYFGAGPGGMAISAAAFRAVLTDLLEGFFRQGFTRVVILNGHGGNAPVIHEVTLAAKLAHGVVVPSFYLWKVARMLMEREIGSGNQRFGHGGEPILSLTRALRPEFVAGAGEPAAGGTMLGLPVSGFGTVEFEGLPVDVPAEFVDVPKDSVAAAMPAADAATGSRVAELLVEKAVRFVDYFAGRIGREI
jgi:creatinine amidohydrolase